MEEKIDVSHREILDSVSIMKCMENHISGSHRRTEVTRNEQHVSALIKTPRVGEIV